MDAIDLRVEAGESVAYVPSAGEVRVQGLVPHRQRIENARNIGNGVGGVLLGGIILWKASHERQIDWDLERLCLLTITLLGAVVIIGAINFATNCVQFGVQHLTVLSHSSLQTLPNLPSSL